MIRPKAAIRRLRSGIVPTEEIDSLSVGYEVIRDLMLDRIVGLGERLHIEPLLIRGEWGTGKSHLISFIRATCRNLGVGSSVVELNARGRALNHPQRFYPLLAQNIELGRTTRGLQQIIVTKLKEERQRRVLEEFAKEMRFGELGYPIGWLCEEIDDSGEIPATEHFAWMPILGGDIAWANKRNKALQRITELGKLLGALGAQGLVLLFDEAETIDQLWNVRSRKGAYSVLGRLCRMDNIWCVLAITARFDATIEMDLNRGVQYDPDLSQHAEWFLRAWRKGELEIIGPPNVDNDAAFTLAKRVEQLYERAHDFGMGHPSAIDSCVDEWLHDPGANPRTLIRSVIDHLDRLRPLVR